MSCEEIFGPVLSVLKPFKTVEEALTRANNTEYGLAAGVFTSNMNTKEIFVREYKAGTVWVNCTLRFFNQLPFGGYKESGFGRDLGIEALDGYTIHKTVIENFKF